MLPTADDVAHAIVAACRETGGNPLDIAKTLANPFDHRTISRARIYASQALRELFPEASKTSLARMVGVPNRKYQETFFQTFDSNRKTGGSIWFNDMALARVLGFICENSTKPIPLPKAEPKLDPEKRSEEKAAPPEPETVVTQARKIARSQKQRAADERNEAVMRRAQAAKMKSMLGSAERTPSVPARRTNSGFGSMPSAFVSPRGFSTVSNDKIGERRRLEDMLRDAVKNTAAMTPPKED